MLVNVKNVKNKNIILQTMISGVAPMGCHNRIHYPIKLLDIDHDLACHLHMLAGAVPHPIIVAYCAIVEKTETMKT